MRSLLVVVILAGLCSALRAQRPVIDSMRVDEWARTLIIHGEFGFAKGAVWCDSVELPISFWSDTMIRAAIPDTGKGSVGPVVVGANGYQTKARILTLLKASANCEVNLFSFVLQFAVRADIHSLLLHGRSYMRNLQLSRSTLLTVNFVDIYYTGHGNGSETSVHDARLYYFATDSTFNFTALVQLSLPEKQLQIDLQQLPSLEGTHVEYQNSIPISWGHKTINVPSFSIIGTLDSALLIKKEGTITSSSCLFGLPATTVLLDSFPELISPRNNTVFVRDGITLQWDSLETMDNYHLQFSTDSTFSTTRFDTIIPALQFALPPLDSNTTYFWRVAGLNSEGQSLWSPIWHFTTNTMLKVTNESPSIPLVLYPNPAHRSFTISFDHEYHSAATITVTDLLGKEVLSQTYYETGASLTMPISLPRGIYLCRIQNEAGYVVKNLIVE